MEIITQLEPCTASVFNSVIFMPVEAGKQSVFQTVGYIKCLSYSTNLLIYCQDKVIESAEEKKKGRTLIVSVVMRNNNGHRSLLTNSTRHCTAIAVKQ